MSHFKNYRYHLEYHALRLAALMVQCLPWRWLRPLGKAIGFFFFVLDRNRRHVALANIKAAFGDEYDEKGRRNNKELQSFIVVYMLLILNGLDKLRHVMQKNFLSLLKNLKTHSLKNSLVNGVRA